MKRLGSYLTYVVLAIIGVLTGGDLTPVLPDGTTVTPELLFDPNLTLVSFGGIILGLFFVIISKSRHGGYDFQQGFLKLATSEEFLIAFFAGGVGLLTLVGVNAEAILSPGRQVALVNIILIGTNALFASMIKVPVGVKLEPPIEILQAQMMMQTRQQLVEMKTEGIPRGYRETN